MSWRVKAVQTADCLILSNGKEEKQIFLAYVSAPRLTEPWGFDAREYLRNLALNKPVRYRTLYEVNSREHGDVASPIFESLVEFMLEKGWVRLRSDAASLVGYTKVGEKLEVAQATAQSKGLGVWSTKPKSSLNLLTEVPPSLYGSDRKVPAIVERVQAGDRVIIRAMLSDNEHYVGPALLGGIRTPRAPTGATGGASDPSGGTNGGTSGGTSAASAATSVVETRLLQRNVRAVFHAPHATSGHPLVSLAHPSGDIAVLLASMGLAEVQQTPVIGSERILELRNTQADAVKRGAGIWKAAAAQRQAQNEQFAHLARVGQVTRVISADTVVVDKDTVQLSSVRAPRRTEDPELAAKAREFMRKLLIGKKVEISVDGASSGAPGSGASEPMVKVTLGFGQAYSKNAGLEAIKAGWATTLHHRRDDLARSPFYDEFVKAEEDAVEKKLGIHAVTKKDAKISPYAVQDASETVAGASSYLSRLQRRNQFPAVVDFVISGGRLRLNVPSENCTLVAVLEGIRVPRAGEPMAEEALDFVYRDWNQRDITCSVSSVDKTGAFISVIEMNKRNLALELLERGFARVAGRSTTVYEDVEENARLKKIGVWALEDEEDDSRESIGAGASSSSSGAAAATSSASASAAAGTASTTPAYQDAVISHCTPDSLFVRFVAKSKHDNLQQALKKFFTAASNNSARSFESRPRKRTSVVDSLTYERGVVLSVRATKCEVELVDTGAVVYREVAELFPLPSQFAIDAKCPAEARELHLRYVHRPVSLSKEAYLSYLEKLKGKTVAVGVEATDNAAIVYTADSKSANDSLNLRIVALGLASVPVSEASDPGAETALEAQKTAQTERIGMWQYGDPREDDDM